MIKSNPKFPKPGGAKKAAAIFKKSRRKTPSEELIKIISEIPIDEDKSPIVRDRVAKDAEY